MALFDKRRQAQAEKLLEGILDAQDASMIVVRGKSCHVLFMNQLAKGQLSGAAVYEYTCKNTFGTKFPGMCALCPNSDDTHREFPHIFDVTDDDGRVFQVTSNKLNWIDERPAIVLYLRDVTEARSAQQRLYSLAYLDQLTGIPNRQKFKEDFEALAGDIAANRKTGAVAIFDIDNFKAVNDTYGHNTGDVMLRRLTEHFQGDPAFSGHVYRLGGDEFVLLYAEDIGRFSSAAEMQDYYGTLMQKSFLSYTMPNIEISCTISMGISFFPQHGVTASELLRKADIALYKAKESGRNCKKFFEDRYDTAKKFKDLYINIQPILTHLGRTYGYELTDRGTEGTGQADSLNLHEFDRTMDALDVTEMDNNSRYFIHFTNQLLSPTVLNNLPKDKFVIQIPATEECPPELLVSYRALKKYGYTLALSDVTEDPLPAELASLADFYKMPLTIMDAHTQKKFISTNASKRFIALGVDDRTAFDEAQRRGFQLFQGFFFSQPVVKKTKDIDPLRVNYLRLLSLTSTDDYVDFAEISTVISSDLALSYKLLRILNSAAVGLKNTVSSIEMGVAYLGEDHLKKWIALLALRGIAADKPLELVRLSLIRAQFGELLAPQFSPPRNAKHVFLVGMFSLLHIALEKTREELFNDIPVSDDIRLSLLTSTGPYSDIAAFFSHYEYSNWDEVSQFARENKLTDTAISDAYISAVKWYNSLAES